MTLLRSLPIFAAAMRQIYLDYNATTPVDPRVIAAMQPYWSEHFGNPSSIHRFGQETRRALNRARRQVARLIAATDIDIAFTSGGTEANNLALEGSIEVSNGGHVITCAAEHSAVLEPLRRLEQTGRITLTILPVDRHGTLTPDIVTRAMTKDTILISIMLANNEVGTVLPIAEIARAVREKTSAGPRVTIHTDAVQALGKIPVQVDTLGVDLLSCSAHKLYGPKGAGALYVRSGTPLTSRLLGGGQERRLRAGTENVPAVVGFGCACDIARERLETEGQRLTSLCQTLREDLQRGLNGVTINGDPQNHLPNTVNVSISDVEGEALLMNLDLHGFAASTGSACASGKVEPSHVLLAMGLSLAEVKSSLRLSLGASTTRDDISAMVNAVIEIVTSLRNRSPSIAFNASSSMGRPAIPSAPC